MPGPAGRSSPTRWSRRTRPAHPATGSRSRSDTVGALITGTTLMGQIERALNRLYGVEQDRPTFAKYGRALRARRDGRDPRRARVRRPRARQRDRRLDRRSTARTIWNVLRWPLGIALLVAAIALIFRWAPRRRQPAWSWLAFGAVVAVGLLALVTLALSIFFQFSTSFGTTYGPLAGIVALLFWSFFSALAVLMGAALAAQLEAVRAGRRRPPTVRRRCSRRSLDPAAPTATPPCRGGRRERDRTGRSSGARQQHTTQRRAAPRARGRHRRSGDRGQPRRGPRATATRSSRRCSRPSRGAGRTIDLLTFVYWKGEIGRAFRRGARRARAGRASASACSSTRGARTRSTRRCVDDDGGCGRAAPLVPSAPPVPAAQGEPSDAPQGDDRRRGGRLHRRRRHRRRVERRRAQRARVARHALPRPGSGGRRAARGVPRQLGRDRPRALRTGRRPVPRPAASRLDGRPVRPRGVGDRLERHLHAVPLAAPARRGAGPDHDGVLRARRTSSIDRICAAAERGVDVEILLPGPHADKRFVQLAGEAVVRDAPRAAASRSGSSSRRCCTRRS